MGSRALERSGHRAIAYDARGHGHSGPAATPEAYTYELLAKDLQAVLDRLEIERAVLAGASMGAHTALRFALEHPERVLALGLITPAFDPDTHGEDSYASWDRLAQGLRTGGVEGFVEAYDLDLVPERFRETVTKVLRQRLSAHDHPLAVADALEAVPRSRPFERWDELRSVNAPTTSSSPVATKPTRPIHWPSANATPPRYRRQALWSRSPAARRSPGREGSSPRCSPS